MYLLGTKVAQVTLLLPIPNFSDLIHLPQGISLCPSVLLQGLPQIFTPIARFSFPAYCYFKSVFRAREIKSNKVFFFPRNGLVWEEGGV